MLLLFSHSAVSKSLQPHGLQHTKFPCPSLSPGVCSYSCPLSQWCHPTTSPIHIDRKERHFLKNESETMKTKNSTKGKKKRPGANWMSESSPSSAPNVLFPRSLNLMLQTPRCKSELWCWKQAPILDHLMERPDSLEKTLMLGKVESRRRRGWQGMGESWHAAVLGVAKSQIQLSNWTELKWWRKWFVLHTV